MEQWLPRGSVVKAETRIKKMISANLDWQIYSTNQETYALAVTARLYEKWISDYSLPRDIFGRLDSESDFWIYCSTDNYMVSSLESGPYPEDIGQVEAFSIAFNTMCKLFPETNLSNAVYIEEYSMILPGIEINLQAQNDVVYGKWITGGVNISPASFDRVSQLMSWVPREELNRSFELAGFESVQLDERENFDGKIKDLDEVDVETKNSDSISHAEMGEKFTLIGRPELERFINDNIIDIVVRQEEYKRMGIPFPGATILYGPPGCGKTYAVERLAEYLGWQRFDMDSSTIASSFIHDTSKKISEIFDQAIDASPSIVVIDEMEAFLSNRNLDRTSSTHHIEEVAEFLRRIPEAISKGVLIFAMTNMIDSIDPAILRRGRFDHIVEVKMPTKDEIDALLKSKFNELPVADDVVAEDIAQQLDSHPMSDITFVLREAGRIAVKTEKNFIDSDCFEKALKTLPKKEEKRKIGFDY